MLVTSDAFAFGVQITMNLPNLLYSTAERQVSQGSDPKKILLVL